MEHAGDSPGFKLIGGRGRDLLLTRHGLIAPLPGYDYAVDEASILKQFDMALGHNFKLKIKYVDDIPFTKAGKYPMSVSQLAMDYIQKCQ